MKKQLLLFVISIFIVVFGAMLKIFEVSVASWLILIGALSVLGSLILMLINLLSSKSKNL
jgi:hypothetical protein